MSSPLFNVYRFSAKVAQSIPAFMVVSSAPVNIEGDSELKTSIFEENSPELEKLTNLEQAIDQITAELDPDQPNVELVIAVHGYNTSQLEVKKWYRDIYKYVNQDRFIQKSSNTVLIGYRWPSEKVQGESAVPLGQKLSEMLQALPVVPGIILWGGLGGLLLTLSLLNLLSQPYRWAVLLLSVLLVIFTFGASVILSLILLRFTGYFRDSYRAANYGVPDLVELLRQLEKSILDRTPGNTLETKQKIWEKRKIKLSFIGHSMGGFVVTNAVRILSDVFDPRSIGTLDMSNPEKIPSGEVGHVFLLDRLVLVSPDIPVDTLVQGRANFLSSSLRRFKEAYLFSNEGDLALRLASTAANYFSFPARTYNHGYRLGNVTVTGQDYGLANLQELSSEPSFQEVCRDAMRQLSIGFSKRRRQNFLELQASLTALVMPGEPQIANLFTYFDCTNYRDSTNYKDRENQSIGVLTYALGRENLNFWNYLILGFGYFFLGKDVHGGYFRGDFSRMAIYRLSFLGFEDVLKSLAVECQLQTDNVCETGLQELSRQCAAKQIKVILAPERYRNDVKGEQHTRWGY